jgi:hypothetical protein
LTIKSKDIKILWGRSGNRCAICRTQLAQDASAVSAAFTLGEQAHIVGEKEDAPRGKSSLTADERDSYQNLILLCPNDHTKIDKNEADWPVERLHYFKSTHELWVTETLSETIDNVKLAQQTALSTIIDIAVESCDLENWDIWISHAMSADRSWSEFRRQVIGVIWPSDYEELQRATTTLSILIHRAVQEFMKNGELSLSGNTYTVDRYYSRPRFNPDYAKQVKEFGEWEARCDQLLNHATKAANWFADVVRRDINPMFFASKGKFLIPEEAFATSLLEFSDEEKAKLPGILAL